MKEVRSSPNPSTVALWQSLLQEAGIQYFVKNDSTQNILVGPSFWAELWVVEDDDYTEAESLLREAREDAPATGNEWKCAVCGETVPGNFTSCWKCQTERHAKPV